MRSLSCSTWRWENKRKDYKQKPFRTTLSFITVQNVSHSMQLSYEGFVCNIKRQQNLNQSIDIVCLHYAMISLSYTMQDLVCLHACETRQRNLCTLLVHVLISLILIWIPWPWWHTVCAYMTTEQKTFFFKTAQMKATYHPMASFFPLSVPPCFYVTVSAPVRDLSFHKFPPLTTHPSCF